MKVATAPRGARVFTGNLLILDNAVRVAGMTNALDRVDLALRGFLPERVKRSAFRKELFIDKMVENASTINAVEDSRKLYPDQWSDDLKTFVSNYKVRLWYILGRCYGFAFAKDTQQYLSYETELFSLQSDDGETRQKQNNAYALGVEQGRKDKQQRDAWQKRERIEVLRERNHPVFGDDE